MEDKKWDSQTMEGVLPASAPLANPYVPFQRENPPRYEARKGMVRGTMYPGLDLPFMGIQQFLGVEEAIKQQYSPILQTQQLCALMDIVSYDTIIDIKVTSQIKKEHLMQVLAYHYLSTYRSDLSIDRVIVYDASTDRYLAVSGLRNGNIKITANYDPK